MQVYNDEQLYHFGVKGMKWGHHKAQIESVVSKTSSKAEKAVYALAAKVNPREMKYKIRKVTNRVNDDVKLLSDLTTQHVKSSGVLPNNKNALKAIESVGITVYRSCNMKFSMNGIAKKMDTMNDSEKELMFSQMSKNFKGKSAKENRVFSTSTSPLFAIDTWRAVNPTAAATYNTYMVINCKKCPGLLADGKTSDGKALVNTRSNQEAILAPNKLTYLK